MIIDHAHTDIWLKILELYGRIIKKAKCNLPIVLLELWKTVVDDKDIDVGLIQSSANSSKREGISSLAG